MKIIVHKMPHGVAITHPSWALIAKMTGEGFGWSRSRIEHEVAKTRRSLRAYYNAVGQGGVSINEAIDLIRAKDNPPGCLGCRVIDDSELPAEQQARGKQPTSRNAWVLEGNKIIANGTPDTP